MFAFRPVLTIAIALGSVAVPTFAQTIGKPADPVQEQRRIINVVVYGDDDCPVAKAPDEVVVCSRRPETEKFRLPPAVRSQTQRPEEGGGSRALAIDQIGRAGPDSCTAVGPAGASGCARSEFMRNKSVRRADRDEIESEATPDPIK